jgi:hypothetical protein
LALIDALPDIFVWRRSPRPRTDARPARAQSPSTPQKTSPSARSWRQRNSAIVEWSGATLPATTRQARSSTHARSMPRAERFPRACA